MAPRGLVCGWTGERRAQGGETLRNRWSGVLPPTGEGEDLGATERGELGRVREGMGCGKICSFSEDVCACRGGWSVGAEGSRRPRRVPRRDLEGDVLVERAVILSLCGQSVVVTGPFSDPDESHGPSPEEMQAATRTHVPLLTRTHAVAGCLGVCRPLSSTTHPLPDSASHPGGHRDRTLPLSSQAQHGSPDQARPSE